MALESLMMPLPRKGQPPRHASCSGYRSPLRPKKHIFTKARRIKKAIKGKGLRPGMDTRLPATLVLAVVLFGCANQQQAASGDSTQRQPPPQDDAAPSAP